MNTRYRAAFSMLVGKRVSVACCIHSLQQKDPEKARDCFEAQLVKLLRNRLVTLITMEMLDDTPMAWTRRELTFRRFVRG